MTTSNTATDPSLRRATAGPAGLSWWRALAAGAVAATVVNLLILLIARAAGAAMVVPDGGTDHAITVGGVILSSAGPMTGGVLLACLLALLWPGFLRLAQVVGGGLGLLSVVGPVIADTDGGTKTALAAMHLVVSVVVVAVLEAIRRHRAVAVGSSPGGRR
jgi:hypothetical protein